MDRGFLKWVVRFSILAVLMLVTISSSGCIQTHLMRDIFFHEPEKEVVYGLEEVVNLHYQFTGDFNAFSYQDNQNFMVKEDARWLTFTVDLKLYILPTSLEHINYEDRSLRYLTVLIIDPLDNVYSYTYEHSTLVTMEPILEPVPGLWKVQIDAYGRGFAIDRMDIIYYDTYSVTAILNQPQ